MLAPTIPLLAQEKLPPFESKSLALRTALHRYPTIEPQLKNLVQLYASENREEELIALYRNHLEDYPEDVKAKAVLARIFKELGREEVDQLIQTASQQHPKSSVLQYLISQNLRKVDEARSLEALSNAIDLEPDQVRSSRWLGELLDRSKTERGRELANQQLEKLLATEGQTGTTMVSLANLMQRHQFWQLSLAALGKALKSKDLAPEQQVDAQVKATIAEAKLGDAIAAGKRLGALLKQLAVTHHRRDEVMAMRIAVIASDKDRLNLLNAHQSTYEQSPTSESAIIDYVEILIANGQPDQAVKILEKGTADLPDSNAIEQRAIALLTKQTDSSDLIRYLNARLEAKPSRNDLRYLLVKAEYENADSHSAKQDFEIVLGGLEGKDKTACILDLARYLRSVDKSHYAAPHYESFLKLEPARLDVTRELCEIYLGNDQIKQVKTLLAKTRSNDAATENLLDLTQLLIHEQWFAPAEYILKQYLSTKQHTPFEVGLALATVQSELSHKNAATSLINQLREQSNTVPNYKLWLMTALRINGNFDSVSDFFAHELSRFNYTDQEWTEDRIENFLFLCETGKQRQLSSRVSKTIQDRLNAGVAGADLKIKLRQLLVRTLENNAGASQQVEEQLNLLIEEDPNLTGEYRLRLAHLYQNSLRPDLAAAQLASINPIEIKNAELLRNSYNLLTALGNRKLTCDALTAITTLEPSDLNSWERRLSILAAEGNEIDFRAAIRSLTSGVAQKGSKTQWRNETGLSLQRHLLDSYWRSIAKLVTGKNHIVDALSLLDSVEREAQGIDLLWLHWTRAWVNGKLGRIGQRDLSIEQLTIRLNTDSNAVLDFPDGLAIPLREAIDLLESSQGQAVYSDPPSILPLLDSPKINWAFEIGTGANVLQTAYDPEGALMILDDRGQLYRVASRNGKLLWKKPLGVATTPSQAIITNPQSTTEPPTTLATARKVRQMAIVHDLVVLPFGNELRAYQCSDCKLVWKAELPRSDQPHTYSSGATPRIEFTIDNQHRIILFDPITDQVMAFAGKTGKLVWQTHLDSLSYIHSSSETKHQLVSMNTGLSVRNNRVLVFGTRCAILNSNTGKPLWGFSKGHAQGFPIRLREQRQNPSEPEVVKVGPESGRQLPTSPSNRNRIHLDYLAKSGTDFDRRTLSFLNHPGSLLAPAAQWSVDRSEHGRIADAVLGDEYLWLMDDSGVRVVSLNLPLAAKSYQIHGMFIGANGTNGWLLNQQHLAHIDTSRNLIKRFNINDMGNHIDAKQVGSWIYVYGDKGVSVFNSVSGKRISSSSWDETMDTYLNNLKLKTASNSQKSQYTWRGRIERNAPGFPAYCYSPTIQVVEGKIFPVFHYRQIIAVSD